MGRLRKHATYFEEAQYFTSYRCGDIEILFELPAGDSEGAAVMDAAAGRITEGLGGLPLSEIRQYRTQERGSAVWSFVIREEAVCEHDWGAPGFWDAAAEWLETGSLRAWREAKEAFRAEWSDRAEDLADCAYGCEVLIRGLRVWEEDD